MSTSGLNNVTWSSTINPTNDTSVNSTQQFSEPFICASYKMSLCAPGEDCQGYEAVPGVGGWAYYPLTLSQCYQMQWMSQQPDSLLEAVTCCSTNDCNAPDPLLDNATSIIGARLAMNDKLDACQQGMYVEAQDSGLVANQVCVASDPNIFVQRFYPSSWMELFPGSYSFTYTFRSMSSTTMYLAVGNSGKALVTYKSIGPAGSAPPEPTAADNTTAALPAEIVIFNPLANPRMQFTVKLPNVSASAYGPSLTTDLAAIVAAQARLTSPEWAEVLLLATAPVTANVAVSR